MKPLRPMLSLLIGLILAGCEHAGDKTPPEISQVHSSIWHYHPTYWTKVGQTVKTSLAVAVEFRLSDPDGLDDLNKVDLVDGTNGRQYNLMTRYAGQGTPGYDKVEDLFNYSSFTSLTPDRVDLANWRVIATDLKGYDGARDFDLSLPDGDSSTVDQSFVYAPGYSPTTNGVEAMQAMTKAENGLLITADPVNETFTIEFKTTDLRAKNYGIWFYQNTTKAEPMLKIKATSFSIANEPIIPGEKTILTLPWSEIGQAWSEAGKNTSLIMSSLKGAHLVLYDAPIDHELIEDGNWFGFAGVSQYFTLPQPE